ncbi:MAG: NAD(P)/FAD-dependent oxidoreductase [Desulfamplus sp.]|nr:NAD(P)/FAD-dependent oxidoreductase [Desulfamplus sp.]
MKQYLIIGNGIAGTTAAEEIRKHDQDGEILLVTNESLPLYSRIRLPDFLCGKIGEKELLIKNQDWHDKHKIRLITETQIEKIDFNNKKASQGSNYFEFDALLLAVGSRAFIPPVKGCDQGGVFSLRSINDANSIIKKLTLNKNLKNKTAKPSESSPNSETIDKEKKEVVVIGGGLLGLEAAAAMLHSGIGVTVVEFCDRLLPRQLDYDGAKLLQVSLEKMGINFKLGEATEEILGKIHDGAQRLASVLKKVKFKPQVTGVKLKSGEILKADAVLFSAGVRPDLSLVVNSDIKVDKGVMVNAQMETSISSIYAAGDVAEYDGINFCIWSEAMEQGRVAGINMAGGDAQYKNIPPSNMLKVAGIALASAGEIDVDGKMDCDIVSTESIYKKIVKDKNGKIVGCIMIGDTTDFNKIFKQIKGE